MLSDESSLRASVSHNTTRTTVSSSSTLLESIFNKNMDMIENEILITYVCNKDYAEKYLFMYVKGVV